MDEEEHLRRRWWRPQAGQTVLDVGCFVGAWTLPALAAGARVHAFDTSDPALRSLVAAARDRAILRELTVVPRAVGEPYPAALVEQIEEGMRPAGPWTSVDDYCHAHRLRPLWIKIDVEGGELAVLEGARRVLGRDRPTLVVELHHLVYDMPADHERRCLGLLRELGYETTCEVLEGYQRRPVHVHAVAT